MKKRIITGLIMLVVLLPMLLIEALFPLLQIVIIGLCVIATFEMINMCEKKKKMSLPVKLIVAAATMIVYIGIVVTDPACNKSLITSLFNQINVRLSFITTLIISCAAIFTCQIFAKDFDASDVGHALMIVFYVALGFSSLTILLFNGMRFIVYLVMICFGTDIFAYVFGMNFGKHKMCPTISPKKSWEGAIGGTIMGTLCGSLFAIFYQDFGHLFVSGGESIRFFEGVFDITALGPILSVVLIVIVSFVLSIFSQIGDLIASKFKRTYEIKDFSQVFPGHGGVLDRFDSLLFGGIIFLCFITIFRMAMPLVLI